VSHDGNYGWRGDRLTRRHDPRVYPPYRLALVTAPTEEPVSRTEAKLHCKVDITTDDTLIDGLIVAARQLVEAHVRRALVTQTWDLYLDYFPSEDRHDYGSIVVPNPPLVSVTSVKYYDDAGTLQTLSASGYRVLAGTPGRIAPAHLNDWPDAREHPDAVVARYVAGYGAASAVPQSLRQAILLLAGHWYENREAVAEGQRTALPLAVESLVNAEAWGLG
jgi:uncharacterized phiE125 gp8 family phage protein